MALTRQLQAATQAHANMVRFMRRQFALKERAAKAGASIHVSDIASLERFKQTVRDMQNGLRQMEATVTDIANDPPMALSLDFSRAPRTAGGTASSLPAAIQHRTGELSTQLSGLLKTLKRKREEVEESFDVEMWKIAMEDPDADPEDKEMPEVLTSLGDTLDSIVGPYDKLLKDGDRTALQRFLEGQMRTQKRTRKPPATAPAVGGSAMDVENDAVAYENALGAAVTSSDPDVSDQAAATILSAAASAAEASGQPPPPQDETLTNFFASGAAQATAQLGHTTSQWAQKAGQAGSSAEHAEAVYQATLASYQFGSPPASPEPDSAPAPGNGKAPMPSAGAQFRAQELEERNKKRKLAWAALAAEKAKAAEAAQAAAAAEEVPPLPPADDDAMEMAFGQPSVLPALALETKHDQLMAEIETMLKGAAGNRRVRCRATRRMACRPRRRPRRPGARLAARPRRPRCRR